MVVPEGSGKDDSRTCLPGFHLAARGIREPVSLLSALSHPISRLGSCHWLVLLLLLFHEQTAFTSYVHFHAGHTP